MCSCMHFPQPLCSALGEQGLSLSMSSPLTCCLDVLVLRLAGCGPAAVAPSTAAAPSVRQTLLAQLVAVLAAATPTSSS